MNIRGKGEEGIKGEGSFKLEKRQDWRRHVGGEECQEVRSGQE